MKMKFLIGILQLNLAKGIYYTENLLTGKMRANPALIISIIRLIYILNKPLYSKFAQRHYGPLFYRAIRYSQNWRAAIEASGIAYKDIRLYPKWNTEKILTDIKNLKKQNNPLNSEFVQKSYNNLHLAARREFGNWGDTVDAAGFDYLKECIKISVKTRLKRIPIEKLTRIKDIFTTKNNQKGGLK